MHGVKRTLLVTGATSGIGRAIAKKLLAQGHTVIGTSRDISKFQRKQTNFFPLQLDLSQLNALPKIIKQLAIDYPVLDGVIFAAGFGLFGSLEEFSYPQMQELLNVNFNANAFITRELIPFLKRKTHSDLIYIGSEAALRGSRKGTIYCASKFALRGFCQALREECSKDQVRVCLINPGMVLTPFFEKLSFSPGDDELNYLLPEDIAEAVAYVLNARPGTVIDEINLNPATRVIKKLISK